MNPRLRQKLDTMVGRLPDLDALFSAENATKDMEQFKRLSREHAEVSDLVALYQQYREAEGDAEAARELKL
ncbi:MAG TPA: PCRF domain-containing protein, partial [Burkholderiales bacterium]|nr:PCRF domain-containing protein [Burkholderiales bacterium]